MHERQQRVPVDRDGPGWLGDYPEVLAQWHPTANQGGDVGDPAAIRAGSARNVWWQCSRGHEWQARVSSRARRGVGCPFCAGQRATPERNLAVLDPQIASTWHPTRNGALTAAAVLPGSTKRVWWQCPVCAHEWDATVEKRVKRRSCPGCSGRRATATTSLAALHPDVAAQWHPTRNGALTPHQVVPGSNKRVWWSCPACDHEWQTSVESRAVARTGCRECAYSFPHRAVDPLTVTHPDLAAQWHPTRNRHATPDQVTFGSNRRVWWQCAAGHEWQTPVSSRGGSRRSGCPFCAGKHPTPERNLAVDAPTLAAQWHPTRNGALRPDQLMAGSARRVWWLCPGGHTWASSPNARSFGSEASCPFCAGSLPTTRTTLAAVVPGLVAEWHPTRNGELTPDDVTAASTRHVWWQCRSCGHSWRASVKNRTATRTGCPPCAVTARRGPRAAGPTRSSAPATGASR